jgi:hypothetical protein
MPDPIAVPPADHELFRTVVKEDEFKPSNRGKVRDPNPYSEMIEGLIEAGDEDWHPLPKVDNVAEKTLRLLREAARDFNRAIRTAQLVDDSRAWKLGGPYTPRPPATETAEQATAG